MCENYTIIATSISDIRNLFDQRDFSIPSDNLILDAYEELAIFVISNFKLPLSHKEYIFKNMGFSGDISETNMLIGLEKKLNAIKGNFSLEFPLRALEVYFSYGEEPDYIDILVLMKLKYLISKVHHLVGESYRFM